MPWSGQIQANDTTGHCVLYDSVLYDRPISLPVILIADITGNNYLQHIKYALFNKNNNTYLTILRQTKGINLTS